MILSPFSRQSLFAPRSSLFYIIFDKKMSHKAIPKTVIPDHPEQPLTGLTGKKIPDLPVHYYVITLVILGFIAFSPVLKNDFVNFDDNRLIFNNSLVTDTNHVSLAQIFHQFRFTPHHKPLVFASWRLEYQLFGYNPLVFHIDNLILHLLNTLLLFLIIRKVNKCFSIQSAYSNAVAFFIALLFAIHPLHVESVAWATERKDMLYSFFFFCSLLTYQMYLERKHKWIWLILSAVCYLLVIFSKSMGITLIAVLFLIDFAYRRKVTWRLLIEKTPFVIIFFIAFYNYGLLTHFTSHTIGLTAGLANTGYASYPANFDGLSPAYVRILVINIRLVLWLGHILLPVKISPLYPQNQILASLGFAIHLFPWTTIGLLILAFKFRKRMPWVLFGLLFFIITISPAVAIAERGNSVFISDRYTYMASTGIILVFVYLLYKIAERRQHHQYLVTTAGVIAFVFIISTFFQCRIWKNSEMLWTKAISIAGNEAAAAYNGRGHYYYVNNRLNAALMDFKKAVELDPGFTIRKRPIYLLSMTDCYLNIGDTNQARDVLELAIKQFPANTDLLLKLGTICYYGKDYAHAIEYYDRCLETTSERFKVYNNLGVTYLAMKDYNQSIIAFEKALEYDTSAVIMENLARLYTNQGKFDKANELNLNRADLSEEEKQFYNLLNAGNSAYSQKNYQEALGYLKQCENGYRQYGGYARFPDYLNTLGSCYYHLNDISNAKEIFKEVIRQDSNNYLALRYLGQIAIYKEKDIEDAVRYNERCLNSRSPDYFSVYSDLGWLYIDVKDYDKAITAYENALKYGSSDGILKNLVILYKQKGDAAKAEYYRGKIRE